jgi:hypothetical protein
MMRCFAQFETTELCKIKEIKKSSCMALDINVLRFAQSAKAASMLCGIQMVGIQFSKVESL